MTGSGLTTMWQFEVPPPMIARLPSGSVLTSASPPACASMMPVATDDAGRETEDFGGLGAQLAGGGTER